MLKNRKTLLGITGILILSLSLTACGDNKPKTPDTGTGVSQTNTSSQPETTPEVMESTEAKAALIQFINDGKTVPTLDVSSSDANTENFNNSYDIKTWFTTGTGQGRTEAWGDPNIYTLHVELVNKDAVLAEAEKASFMKVSDDLLTIEDSPITMEFKYSITPLNNPPIIDRTTQVKLVGAQETRSSDSGIKYIWKWEKV